ncbi:MAG: DsbA family protein [Flavobacteriales bacterium]
MKIEVWSDVVCPFCYIGKRKFELGLEQFAHKDSVEIVWKSFQLNPSIKTDTTISIYQSLADQKGWTLEYSRSATKHVTDMAEEVGLHYDFDKTIVANTFNAHRLIHLAKSKGKQSEAEELLFKSYFIDGKNIDDDSVLISLGIEIGIDSTETVQMLSGHLFEKEVQQDIYEAQQVGVRGVPFFVLDDKYALSGAQQPEVFLSALNQVWAEFSERNATTKLEIKEGAACTPDAGCE